MERVARGPTAPPPQHSRLVQVIGGLLAWTGQREPSAGAGVHWRRLARATIFAAFLVVSLTLVLTFQFLPSRYDLRPGDVSAYTVKSPEKITFVSQARTREAKQAAAAAVPDEYVLNPAIADKQRQAAVDALTKIGDIRRSTATIEMKRDGVLRISDLVLPPATIDALLGLDESAWQTVTTETLRVVDRLMRNNRIADSQLENVRSSIPTLVDPSLFDAQAAAVTNLARSFVKPNYLLDAEATAAKRKDAQDKTEPVRVTIERGETILRDGDIVQEYQIEKLQAVGLRNPTFRWKDVLATGLLVGLMAGSLAFYVYRFHPAVADDPRRLLVLALLVAITSLAAKLTITGRDVNTYYAYLFPIAAASMLVAVLLDVGLALATTAVLAVVAGLVTSTSFEFATLTLVSGTIGLLAVSKLERLTTVLRAGFYVAVANFAVIVGFYLFGTEIDTQRLALLAFLSLVNGLLAAILALGTVYLIGQLFGITTAMGMLELAHPSQPLFRRLLTEAPGTYHHSVVVANLAERAAEVVGADALLCRIGAYYHDVGKVVRPYAFIENQVGGENIHDELDPVTSTRIILAHVTDGLALARRNGVPRRVQDMIAQHHGTGLVGYFYRQACNRAGQQVDDRPFRYSGPRPQTREAGIMLLADSVEATVRAGKDHSPEAIAAAVRRIVAERVADGQLDDCDLTLRDLERIRETFGLVLQGIFHPRIAYPAPAAPLEAGRASGGGAAG